MKQQSGSVMTNDITQFTPTKQKRRVSHVGDIRPNLVTFDESNQAAEGTPGGARTKSTTKDEDLKLIYSFVFQRIWGIYLVLFFCRIVAIIFGYMYHDWLSLLILLWVSHSCISQSMKRFSMLTYYFYLPLIIMISMFYYIINIDQVLP